MSDSIMTAGTVRETGAKVCAVPAPTVLPQIEDPRHMAPANARELTKLFVSAP
ncbi:hypothetical protein [Streptomyces decoyicus]|uniref:hypothetical protein n=1 Tax=Streptomyces decoyicus TaxID=249567 RepID=UPI000A9E7063|nr:hypothetical protein [Streptomyces decoyicus]